MLVSADRQIHFTLFVVKADSGELVTFTQAIVDEVYIFICLHMKYSLVFISGRTYCSGAGCSKPV